MLPSVYGNRERYVTTTPKRFREPGHSNPNRLHLDSHVLALLYTRVLRGVYERNSSRSRSAKEVTVSCAEDEFSDLSHARDYAEQMKERGELRTSREANLTKYLRSW